MTDQDLTEKLRIAERGLDSLAHRLDEHLGELEEARAALKQLIDERRHVWAVVFSNCEPAEVDDLFDNEAAARAHARYLGADWRAERWSVHHSPLVGLPGEQSEEGPQP
jgi:hypothetical protein